MVKGQPKECPCMLCVTATDPPRLANFIKLKNTTSASDGGILAARLHGAGYLPHGDQMSLTALGFASSSLYSSQR